MRLKTLLIICIAATLFLSCGSESENDDTNKVELINEVDKMASDYDNSPEDTEEVDMAVTVNDTSVDDTVGADVGTTDSEDVDVSITIPESLASRARFSDVTIQVWLNGVFYDVDHDGTQQIVTTSIKLKPGSNVLCIILTKDGKSYRSVFIHIYYYIVDAKLVGRWIKTTDHYDSNTKVYGFEITQNAVLYELLLTDATWERGEKMADSMVAKDGVISYFNSDEINNQYTGSTYSFSNDDTHLHINNETDQVYGVKMTE
ncbi:MAG: hypothetical protein PF637_09495 [Spirochaetes bacterium]|jgi:hypothetical protein|nr:hypothetical protein [Spirochaetota bacterium]